MGWDKGSASVTNCRQRWPAFDSQNWFGSCSQKEVQFRVNHQNEKIHSFPLRIFNVCFHEGWLQKSILMMFYLDEDRGSYSPQHKIIGTMTCSTKILKHHCFIKWHALGHSLRAYNFYCRCNIQSFTFPGATSCWW